MFLAERNRPTRQLEHLGSWGELKKKGTPREGGGKGNRVGSDVLSKEVTRGKTCGIGILESDLTYRSQLRRVGALVHRRRSKPQIPAIIERGAPRSSFE